MAAAGGGFVSLVNEMLRELEARGFDPGEHVLGGLRVAERRSRVRRRVGVGAAYATLSLAAVALLALWWPQGAPLELATDQTRTQLEWAESHADETLPVGAAGQTGEQTAPSEKARPAATPAPVAKPEAPRAPEPGATPGFARTTRLPAPREVAVLAYRRGFEQAQRGQREAALEALREALALDPRQGAARQALATVLLGQGQIDAAQRVVDVGLELEPGSVPLRMLKARCLALRGRVDEALHALGTQGPPLPASPDFYALTAGLYQRRGEHGRALSLYRALLQRDPKRSSWWMGLAISLEGSGLRDGARAAFQKAVELGALGPESLGYARQRIAALSSAEG